MIRFICIELRDTPSYTKIVIVTNMILKNTKQDLDVALNILSSNELNIHMTSLFAVCVCVSKDCSVYLLRQSSILTDNIFNIAKDMVV